MPLPDTIIEEAQGNLGALIALADGVAGFVLTGDSNGDIVAGTPFKVTSYEAAVNLGLTEASNAFAHKVIKQFYDEAGNGAECYIMLVSNAMTVNLMADKTNVNGARKLLDFGEGKIRLLGIMDNPASVTVTNGLDGNVYTAGDNLELLAVEYAGTGIQAPFWGFVGATGYTGVDTDLVDQTQNTNEFVSIVLADSGADSDSSFIGTFIGRKAKEPVQRKASRVKSGKLAIAEAYVGDIAVSKDNAAVTAIHNKGYITVRKFPNKTGYFFANDFTCTPSTSDYHIGARRMTMNKIRIIAYAVLVEEVDDEVPVAGDGKIDAPYALYLEAQVENQVSQIMVANGELSSFSAFVDTNQNVLSTSETVVALNPTPVGYNSTIRAKIAYQNPALTA